MKTKALPKLKPLARPVAPSLRKKGTKKGKVATVPKPLATVQTGQIGRPTLLSTVEAAKGALKGTTRKPHAVVVPAGKDPDRFRNSLHVAVKHYLTRQDLLPEGKTLKSQRTEKHAHLWLQDAPLG